MAIHFQQTSIHQTGKNSLIVSLRLDGNNFFWGDSLCNGLSIRHSIFESTRYHSPTINIGPLWLSTLIIWIWNHCHALWESRNKDKHGHDTEQQRVALLAQVQRRMAVMYELKNRCFPSDRLKWFHPTLDEHITKEPHLYQQQAWLETYEPMIRRRIHDRDRVTQQRLHTIHEYFPPLPAGTANR
jgi:hypothetical protein